MPKLGIRSLRWDEVRGRRLARSHLVEPAPADRLVDVVADVCGLQAQVLSAAELGIGQRVAGVTQSDVRDALWRRHELVKTWSLRGTLHLHPAGDLPLWAAANRARPGWDDAVLPGGEPWPEPVDRLTDAIGDALAAGCLTRSELADVMVARFGEDVREPMMSGWGLLLQPAAYRGLLCFGPSRGAQVTFTRPDRWTGRRWADLDPAAALGEVLRRYLRAYGPARHQDVARWLAVDPPLARRVLDSLGDEIEPVDVEGHRAWVRAADDDGWTPVAGSVRLLPQYDCFVIGFHPRDQLTSAAAIARIRSFRRGRWEGVVALPVLLVDGVVAGLWERSMRAARVDIRVEVFGRLTARQRAALDVEAARIGAYYDRAASLTLGTLA